MNNKVTVIVPIYNTKQYIYRCVNSILGQTYDNIEIILVDDGSSDGCAQICNELAKNNSNIIVIHKKNEGAGLARNCGLNKATGSFIQFVDSDDYIEPYTVERVLKQIKSEKADACFFSCKKKYKNEVVINENNSFPGTLKGDDIRQILLPKCFGASQRLKDVDLYSLGSASMAIYKKSFLIDNKIKFMSEREVLSEDTFFVINVCRTANCITFINEDLYVYCENLSSYTHTYKADKFDRLCSLYYKKKDILDCLKYTCHDESLLRSKDSFVSYLIAFLKLCVADKSFSLIKKYKEVKKICTDPRTKDILSGYPIRELGPAKGFYIKMVETGSVLIVLILTEIILYSK